MGAVRDAAVRFENLDSFRFGLNGVRMGGDQEALRRTESVLDVLRLCRDLRAHPDFRLMKKIDWNAVAFVVLILVLMKNAALNAASAGLLSLWK